MSLFGHRPSQEVKAEGLVSSVPGSGIPRDSGTSLVERTTTESFKVNHPDELYPYSHWNLTREQAQMLLVDLRAAFLDSDSYERFREKAALFHERYGSKVTKGSRHTFLMAKAVARFKETRSLSDNVTVLRMWNNDWCLPPLSDNEVQSIAIEACQPKYLPEPEPKFKVGQRVYINSTYVNGTRDIGKISRLLSDGRYLVETAGRYANMQSRHSEDNLGAYPG